MPRRSTSAARDADSTAPRSTSTAPRRTSTAQDADSTAPPDFDCDGTCYITDRRLENWNDPTPRESQFTLEELREACVAAAKRQISSRAKSPTREERLKYRDEHDRNSLMIALQTYAKKNNLQSSDFEFVQVKERNLIDEYGKGYTHFNFVAKGLNGEVKKFFAELHPDIKDDTGVYLCTPLEENDKGHCYGCKDRASGLAHPNEGGFLGGHKDVGFPFMEFESDDDQNEDSKSQ